MSVSSGVARAFPGERVTHLEGENKEENEQCLRKNKIYNMIAICGKMKKVELLPTQDFEAGYGPVSPWGCMLVHKHLIDCSRLIQKYMTL